MSFSERVLLYVGVLAVPLALGVGLGQAAIALMTDDEAAPAPASQVQRASPVRIVGGPAAPRLTVRPGDAR